VLTAGWQQGDGRSVFCVGDPMQSIYRFRHAEVRAFLELAEDGIGDVRFDVQRLTSNFRTAKPLVEWINATSRGSCRARRSRSRRDRIPAERIGARVARGLRSPASHLRASRAAAPRRAASPI
jgi:superfamily I DNA/RNA helicase